MFALKLTALFGLAVLGASAVPKAVQPRVRTPTLPSETEPHEGTSQATTTDPACPVVSTETFTQTLSIIAPTTTGPFETTTFTEVVVSYPIATTTETQVDANGKSYTVTYTYENYYDDPPYPSDCHCECRGAFEEGCVADSAADSHLPFVDQTKGMGQYVEVILFGRCICSGWVIQRMKIYCPCCLWALVNSGHEVHSK